MGGFADWFSRQLVRKELTASDFAERTGIPYRTVHSWISGERLPGPKSIDRIADVLNADVTALMQLAGHLPTVAPADPSDPRELLAGKIRRLDLRQTEPWQIEALEVMVDAWLAKQRASRR